MSLGVQAVMPEISSDQAVVVLFDEAIVIFLVGATASDLQMEDLLLPVAQEMLIEELCTIVGMDFLNSEG